MTEVSSIMAKICNINFWIETFGTFPKIHPFWKGKASLKWTDGAGICQGQILLLVSRISSCLPISQLHSSKSLSIFMIQMNWGKN